MNFNTSYISTSSSYGRSYGFSVRCFANEVPTVATVSYSTTQQTYNPVIATITFNKTGITLAGAEGRERITEEDVVGVRQKIFTANTTEQLMRTNSDGQTGTVTVTIDQIQTRAACETETIKFGDYTIAACNVGASVAGTSEASYGEYFQWGNNYGFVNT
ncbi:MAG: hypothetical protein LBD75_05255 [Candidatus Peribacteria bacterium]|jgi:hypothetical protein|nr:hypothetical protein [Candidatus Peribacteria bacterium]